MKTLRKPNGYWTLERCLQDASKYKTRGQWSEDSPGSYDAAQRNGWLDLCGKHMPVRLQKPWGHWTLERCIEAASKYQTRYQWSKGSGSSHNRARRYGWLDQCCKHM